MDRRRAPSIGRIEIPDEGAKPMGIAVSPDGRSVYVSNGRGGSVSIIDAASGQLVRSIPDVGERPWGIGVIPDGKKLYTANGPSNDVTVIDLESGKILFRIPVGSSPWGIAIGARKGAL